MRLHSLHKYHLSVYYSHTENVMLHNAGAAAMQHTRTHGYCRLSTGIHSLTRNFHLDVNCEYCIAKIAVSECKCIVLNTF